ncbi:phosphohistidine phosphatase SixA [Coleofasciculus sp. H7-2]|uniref:phosphohistidine phosphatase SixA n=1 Tax=Coleofasciculus sp. H7-2 TaxID=3351545 RepID=UPI003672411F
MELYLIRHGIAAEASEDANDEERSLTREGHKKTAKVAKRLDEIGLRFDLILTSPLVRARQTAEILVAAGLCPHLEESSCLAPAGDIKTWLSWLEAWQLGGGMKLALVGHQPNLGNWAEILVWDATQEALILKKAGMIGLTLPSARSPVGHSQMFLLTSPKWLL